MAQMAGNNERIYYTKYELTGDTTIRKLLTDNEYHVHYENVMILIRANGSIAPQTGNYTMNNYLLVQQGTQIIRGIHNYISGRVPPDNASLFSMNEGDIYLKVRNGVLTYTNESSTSCLGTTGDNVVLVEIPFDNDKYTGID